MPTSELVREAVDSIHMKWVVLAAILARVVWAQDGPKFEVASVKPADPNAIDGEVRLQSQLDPGPSLFTALQEKPGEN